MKSKFIVAALALGLASPAAASTLLDFTSSAIGVGNTTGSHAGVGYTITGVGGALTNATHGNNNGCNVGYSFACAGPTNGKYDVGFGVVGNGNNNEINGMIASSEYVEVKFDSVVKLLGFAGMLTYNNNNVGGGTEQVRLDYSKNGEAFNSLYGNTQNIVSDGGGSFGTVGLSFLKDLMLQVDTVRFYAFGTIPFDDGNANVTAAALEIAAVPLPAGLPLLLAGMGALGFAARRKKRMAS